MLFGNDNELQRHLKSVDEIIRDHKCDSCDKCFGYKSGMNHL